MIRKQNEKGKRRDDLAEFRHPLAPRRVEEDAVELTSLTSSPVKALLRLLNRRQFRHESRRFVAEGETFLRMRPRTIFVRKSRWLESGDELMEIARAGGEEGALASMAVPKFSWGHGLDDNGAPNAEPGVAVLSDEVFDAITTQENSQGVMCIFPMPNNYGTDDDADGPRRAIVLDECRQPSNLGVIMRSMEAFGVSTLVLMSRTVDVYNPKVVRCSMGAAVRGRIRVLYAEDAAALRRQLRGWRLFAATAAPTGRDANMVEGVVDPTGLAAHLSGQDAFIFGSEAHGVSKELLFITHTVVQIPMDASVDSLNVGVAAGIVMFAAAAAEVKPNRDLP